MLSGLVTNTFSCWGVLPALLSVPRASGVTVPFVTECFSLEEMATWHFPSAGFHTLLPLPLWCSPLYMCVSCPVSGGALGCYATAVDSCSQTLTSESLQWASPNAEEKCPPLLRQRQQPSMVQTQMFRNQFDIHPICLTQVFVLGLQHRTGLLPVVWALI